MRIGIDMLAVQAPGSRHRGIGRYGFSLVSALLRRDAENEYVLYAHEELPVGALPEAPHATARRLRHDPARRAFTMAGTLDLLARTNPDGLDLLLTLSPFEMGADYCPPARPLDGPAMAAVVYDFIPFLFQEQYMAEPHWAARYYRNLRSLLAYDALLAISGATRADGLGLTGLPTDRVVDISGAADDAFFGPEATHPAPADPEEILHALGITRPFAFCLSGQDEWNDRKNLWGLIEAYRLLPERLRRSHQLVVSCAMTPRFVARARRFAAERGVNDGLVLTGGVPDETLRVLYQRCSAFVFPSFYEGFGLPILEAMRCGAAVVAGNNSSQVEVVGDAGLLVNAHDAADIAAKTARVLEDRDLARRLGERALEQARPFTWDRTASRALDALTAAVSRRPRRRLRLDAGHGARPRLAFFSPLPPKGSGISDYAARLVDRLKEWYAIDLYHEEGYVPDLGLASPEFGCYDHRVFPRRAALLGYRAVLYQMGNSHYHRFIYEALLRHPGIVTLHDFCLAGFHYWYGDRPGADPEYFRRELAYSEPGRAPDWAAVAGAWLAEPGGVQEAFARRGLAMNRRVFESARRVIVHSPWGRARVGATLPEHEGRTVVVPMGATPKPAAPGRRDAARRRFDLPADALVVGCFGILHPTKMNVETIEAFRPLARELPGALLMFVGQDWGLGEARDRAVALGLESRVRFLGRQPSADFDDLIAATDIGISLRRPPTNGETSAALLDLLRAGVPTIITDVAAFSGYPDAVVRKVAWEREGADGLRRALWELAGNRPAREALGRAAAAHVAAEHDWARTAALYRDQIERCHAEAAGARGGPHRAPAPTAAAPRP